MGTTCHRVSAYNDPYDKCLVKLDPSRLAGGGREHKILPLVTSPLNHQRRRAEACVWKTDLCSGSSGSFRQNRTDLDDRTHWKRYAVRRTWKLKGLRWSSPAAYRRSDQTPARSGTSFGGASRCISHHPHSNSCQGARNSRHVLVDSVICDLW